MWGSELGKIKQGGQDTAFGKAANPEAQELSISRRYQPGTEHEILLKRAEKQDKFL